MQAVTASCPPASSLDIANVVPFVGEEKDAE
jgi:hypothetical protein